MSPRLFVWGWPGSLLVPSSNEEINSPLTQVELIAQHTQDISPPQWCKKTKIYTGPTQAIIVEASGRAWEWDSSSPPQLSSNISSVSSPSHLYQTPFQAFITPLLLNSESVLIKQVSFGPTHVLLLDVTGRVWTRGRNHKGQLGVGTFDDSTEWTLIPLSNQVQMKYIATGKYHSASIDVLGRIWTWGDGSLGQLGYATSSKDKFCMNVPKRISNFDSRFKTPTFQAIVCGHFFCLALTLEVEAGETSAASLQLSSPDETSNEKGSGIVYAWGCNRGGALGLGLKSAVETKSDTKQTTSAPSDNQSDKEKEKEKEKERPVCILTPRVIDSLLGSTIKTVIAGPTHAFAITKGGRLYGWGYGDSGQVGYGVVTRVENKPYALLKFARHATETRIVSITSSASHTLALEKKRSSSSSSSSSTSYSSSRLDSMYTLYSWGTDELNGAGALGLARDVTITSTQPPSLPTLQTNSLLSRGQYIPVEVRRGRHTQVEIHDQTLEKKGEVNLQYLVAAAGNGYSMVIAEEEFIESSVLQEEKFRPEDVVPILPSTSSTSSLITALPMPIIILFVSVAIMLLGKLFR